MRELDFRREAGNIGRFAAAFAGSRTVFIPQAISGLVSGGLMIQERSGGLRVDDPSLRDQGPQLARSFVDAYLHQFFVMGVFHGDQHPGNLFVMTDGRICFHDFGLVGKLDLGRSRAGPLKRSHFGKTDYFVHTVYDLRSGAVCGPGRSFRLSSGAEARTASRRE